MPGTNGLFGSLLPNNPMARNAMRDLSLRQRYLSVRWHGDSGRHDTARNCGGSETRKLSRGQGPRLQALFFAWFRAIRTLLSSSLLAGFVIASCVGLDRFDIFSAFHRST